MKHLNLTAVSLLLIGLTMSGTVYSQVPQSEREALIALYYATSGANWTNKTGWNGIAGTECDWYGVTCTGGDLTELRLNSNNLVGTIPSGLGNLTTLEYLSFYDNSLTGTIPVELGNLTTLTSLSLTSNQLSGTIPSSLGNLTSLTYLALAINQLTGSIPAELGNLTSVAYLTLGTNQLSGSIPTALGDLSSLLYLMLYGNALTGSIPSELGNLTNLIYLNLYDNQLSGSIPKELGSLSNLTNLNLYTNQLSGSIPEELGNLTNLINLSLGHNQLSGSIPKELGSLSNLTALNLYDNQLSDSIPKELGSLSNLTILSLYDNALTGLLRSELGNLTALTDLRLDNNQLSGSIPAAFSTIPTINVSSNPKLDRNVLIKLYDSTNGDNWTNKTGWNGAVGSECDWYGVSCHYPSIGSSSPYYQHQTIESLRLTSNNLSGTIPTEIGNLCDAERALLGSSACTQLLSFYDNSLTGTIPAELGNLTTLTSLSLTSNQLSGTIPSSLGNLTSLTYLALAINQLTGSIPAELGNLTSVIYLTLGTNQLSGSIPTVFGNLSSLKYLFLYSNALTGSIPSELGDLTSLINFRLDGNKLSGVIPTQLSNLTALTELRLDNNKLVGPMPQWLSDMAISTLNVTDAFTSAPIVAISGGSRTIEDTDGIAGESVSFTGTATDSDGTIATTQWLVDGSEVATGLTPSIALPNGSTIVTFKAIDNDGASTSATVTITAEAPIAPSVTISGGSRTIADTNGISGESVSFTGTATDSDGTIATTQWLVDGSEVATGLTPSIALPNGSTVVTFKATDNVGVSSTTTATITVNAPVAPSVTISGGNRTIADTDDTAGESVSFTGTATDSDGIIETTQWLVNGSVVATGLSAAIALPNGSSIVTFKATDNSGLNTTTTATITITAPSYTATDEWPSPYNGVTPDSSLGLVFNNIGIYDAADSTIYTCLRIFTDGLPGSASGISEFDIGLTVVSLDEGTVQITTFREFNVIGALNENVELPDCSGKFETTTAVFTDTIETKLYSNFLGNMLPIIKTFETTFNLIDGDNLILKLSSYKELTAE